MNMNRKELKEYLKENLIIILNTFTKETFSKEKITTIEVKLYIENEHVSTTSDTIYHK